LIDALAQGGGVIGLTPHGPFNWNGDPGHTPALEDYLTAIDYVVNRVGIDHVGIGTDSEATKGAYPQPVRDELARRYPNLSSEYFETLGPDAPRHVVGFRGLRDLPKITAALLQRGYEHQDVAKVLGGNFLRVYEDVWPR
jgi:membrane dipeptidase